MEDSSMHAYLIPGKWGRGGSWSPRGPSQPPLLPWAQTTTAANTLLLWPSALLTSTWILGDPPPHLGAFLATVQRAFSSQDPDAHFSSGSFTMNSFRLGQQGASHAIPDASGNPQPCPALPCPTLAVSLSLVPPLQKAVGHSFVLWWGRALLGIHWSGCGSLSQTQLLDRQPRSLLVRSRGSEQLPRAGSATGVLSE